MNPDMRDVEESDSGERCSTHRPRRVFYLPLTERVIRCLWYAQHLYLKRKITALDGRTIQVISPGYWNTGRGPDFLHGVFYLGKGKKLCGDVEIHREQADWKAHGHQADPFFKNVRLHVFMGTHSKNGSCRELAGKRITEVCLLKQMRNDLRGLIGAINPERYPYAVDVARGRCSSVFKKVGERTAVRVLREAGEKRLARKAVRVGALARKRGEEQAIYRLLLESLGYASCKKSFAQLSERLPWKLLRRIVVKRRGDSGQAHVEAALLGIAGLIPDRPAPGWDSESKRHWEKSYRAWENLQSHWGLKPMDGVIWKRWGSRPANSPHRRVSAIGPLLSHAAESGLAMTILPPNVKMDRHLLEDHFRELLGGHRDLFWQRHYTWGGKRLSSSTALLGRDRILAIVATVLLPLLSHRGGEASARRILNQLPAGAPNSITRLMRARLFGNEDAVVRSGGMAAQQGLIQIYKMYCARDRSGCQRCGFPSSIK
jgi:hypothetical protein